MINMPNCLSRKPDALWLSGIKQYVILEIDVRLTSKQVGEGEKDAGT